MASSESPSSAEDASLKAQRVKSLLSSYYGAAEDPSSNNNGHGDNGAGAGAGGGRTSHLRLSSPSSSSSSSVSLNVDAAHFDKDRFMRQLLRGTRLDGLLKKHADMSSEIRSLDSDMQMLVYENYSKFIAATDTIRTMKHNVDTMTSNTDQLMTLMGGVAVRSDSVNDKLDKQRNKIEELSRVRTVLKKLQVLLDLPARLKACLEADALTLAVGYVAGAKPLLSRYAALADIRPSVEQASVELRKRLYARLGLAGEDENNGGEGEGGQQQQQQQKRATTTSEQAECIALLGKLGEPTERLQADLLGAWCAELKVALASVTASEQEEVREASAPPPPPPPPQEVVRRVSTSFLGEVARCAKVYAELFPPEGRATLVASLSELFKKCFATLEASLSYLPGDDDSEEDDGSESLTSVRSLVAGGGSSSTRGAAALASALASVCGDLESLSPLLPELKLAERSQSLMENVLRARVARMLSLLEARIEREIVRNAAGDGASTTTLQDAYGAAVSCQRDGLAAYLGDCRVMMGGIAGDVRLVLVEVCGAGALRLASCASDAVQRWSCAQLGAYLAWGTARDPPPQGGPPPSSRAPPPPGALLTCAMLLKQYSATAAAKEVESALGDGVTAADALRSMGPSFVESSQRALMAYAEAVGRRLALTAGTSFELVAWRTMSSAPRRVSEGMKMVLSQVADVETETRQLLPSTGAAGESAQLVARDVERMVGGSGDGITYAEELVGRAVAVMLGDLIARVRASTFSVCGLQQLQLDVHALRGLSRFSAGDAVPASTMLDRVLAAAERRCLETPTLLEKPILERLSSG